MMLNRSLIFFTLLISVFFPPFIFVNITSSLFRTSLFVIFLIVILVKLITNQGGSSLLIVKKYFVHFFLLLIYFLIIVYRALLLKVDFSISFGYFLILIIPLSFQLIFLLDKSAFFSRLLKFYILSFKIICYCIILNKTATHIKR